MATASILGLPRSPGSWEGDAAIPPPRSARPRRRGRAAAPAAQNSRKHRSDVFGAAAEHRPPRQSPGRPCRAPLPSPAAAFLAVSAFCARRPRCRPPLPHRPWGRGCRCRPQDGSTAPGPRPGTSAATPSWAVVQPAPFGQAALMPRGDTTRRWRQSLWQGGSHRVLAPPTAARAPGLALALSGPRRAHPGKGQTERDAAPERRRRGKWGAAPVARSGRGGQGRAEPGRAGPGGAAGGEEPGGGGDEPRSVCPCPEGTWPPRRQRYLGQSRSGAPRRAGNGGRRGCKRRGREAAGLGTGAAGPAEQSHPRRTPRHPRDSPGAAAAGSTGRDGRSGREGAPPGAGARRQRERSPTGPAAAAARRELTADDGAAPLISHRVIGRIAYTFPLTSGIDRREL